MIQNKLNLGTLIELTKGMRFQRFLKLIILLLFVVYYTGDAFCNPVAEQLERTNALFGMLVGKNTLQANKPILRPFNSDGCSLSPNSFFKVDFVECCVEHDIAYWLGGTSEQKIAADNIFRSCMNEKIKFSYTATAYQSVAYTYYWGVRIGGDANLPNSFRWGYGWNYLRGYVALSKEEIQQAENLYGKNLDLLRTQVRNKTFKYTLQLYTFDNSIFTFMPSDKIVYSYLRKVLGRTDMVTYGAQKILDSKTQSYVVKLQSCGDHPIEFKLNLDFIKDSLSAAQRFDPDSIDYQNAIISISDKAGCLK